MQTAEIIKLPSATAVKMRCSSCGVTADAACDCGAPYVPVSERAKQAIQAHPEKSDRAIAKDIGVSHEAVSKARRELTVNGLTVEKRVGLDGKARRMPPKPKEDPENYRTAFLLRTDLARNAGRDCVQLMELNAESATPELTKDIARAARAVATAWSALAETLENSA
jgi:hypothetical protein